MNTPAIFRKICDLLGYSEEEYTNKIGEFYTSLTTDKRFILLDSAEWDLRDNHAVKISVDEEDDEEEIEYEEEEETEFDDEDVEEDVDDIEEPLDDEELDIDDEDDDIEDLAIIDEEDIDA